MATNPPNTASTSLSIDEAVRLYSVLQHFFEVSVHTVLYYRRLYPERAFGAVSAFGVAVHQCRHPAVCAWVRGAVEEMMRQLCGVAKKPVTAKKNKGKGKQVVRPKAKPKWQPRRLEETTSLPPDRVNSIAILVHAPFEQEEDSDDEKSEEEKFDERGADACDDEEEELSASQIRVPLPAGAVLERWVFDVRHLPHGWPGGIQALRRARKDLAKRERQNKRRGMGRNTKPRGTLEDEADLSDSEDNDYFNDFDDPDSEDKKYVPGTGRLNWPDMEAQMRGVVMRLAQTGQQVAALPEGCTFTMAVELSDPVDPSTDKKPRRMDARKWIPETGLVSEQNRKRKFGGERDDSTREDRIGTGKATTTAVRSVDSAPLFLECWVEESTVKRAVTEGRSAQLALRQEDVLPDEESDEDTDEYENQNEVLEDDGMSDTSEDMPDDGGAVDTEPQPAPADEILDTESEMSFGADISFGEFIDNSFNDGV